LGIGGRTYRVHLKVPWLAWFVEVDGDLLVLEPELLDHDVCAMRPRAAVVRVEGDGIGGAAHDVVMLCESGSYTVVVKND
jgi:hypothetical protein